MRATYGLYKGDELIRVGTKDELARLVGVKPETIYYYTTKAYRKRFKDASRRRIAVRLD
jgi:hypothetical protein